MLRHLMLVAALLGTMLLQGCINLDLKNYFPTPDYREVIVREGGADKILMLDIDGVITSGASSQSSLFSSTDSTVTSISERLAVAKKDKSIKAIILRIDSPGGGVTASDIVYQMIRDYKAETQVPVYVSMLDLAASGGYYISMAGDKIYAHPTTVTGSIGVIAMFPQLQNLGDKLGVSAEVIKSGPNKDMGSPFKNMTPEHRAIMQSMIDSMYERFLVVVKTGRPSIAPDKIRALADGRIYTAQGALDAGLIDGIAYLEDVIKTVRTEQKLDDATVVLYRKSAIQQVDSIYAKADDPAMAKTNATQNNVSIVNVPGMQLTGNTEVFQYLWMP